MIVGAAILLGAVLFALDNVTSEEPEGLGTWISTVLGLLLGASTGIKGWLDWNKKEIPTQATKNIALDNAQLATGESGRNIQTKEYVEQNIQNYYEATKADVAFHPLHQLPQPPADFTGREELIVQLLADFQSGKGATITGLTGMGGIGKTSLGLVVAHQVAKDYPDAQIFLDLRGTTEPLSAADVMRHVVLSFEPAVDLRALDEAGIANAYRSLLHGKRALLFLDNARSAEQVDPLRPPATCAMLVTSRWTFSVPGLHTRRLDVMTPADAEAFLLELCPRVSNKAAELAKACGCLPLALRIAGSFLEVNENWNVEEYLVQLHDRKRRLAALQQSHEDAELKTEPDLRAAFELSYHQLSEEDRKHWRVLSVFPTSFHWVSAGAIWSLENDITQKLLSLLLRYSLLDHNETSSRYSLHDLLADYALSQMNDKEEYEARLQHASHYKDVLRFANDLYLEGSEKILAGLHLFDLEWENIRTGWAWASQTLSEAERLELGNEYPNAGFMLLILRLDPREYIVWLKNGLDAAKKLGNKSYQGYHLGNLGTAYAVLGQPRKAIEYYEQHLAIARETNDRLGEGNALGNLGNVYADLGEPRKAIQFYERHLAIAREIRDHRGEGNSLGNLGNAYVDLGETRKAIEFYEQRLAIARDIGDRWGEGITLANLGVAYKNLGETRKAIEFYEQGLVIDREIGDRRGEGIDLGNLGVAYKNLGETRKAIEFYERHLAIAREIDDRDGEARALFNWGLALYDLEEKDRAIQHVKQALEIFETIESPTAEVARKKLKEWGAL